MRDLHTSKYVYVSGRRGLRSVTLRWSKQTKLRLRTPQSVTCTNLGRICDRVGAGSG